jgi:hypothetical protein
VCVYKNVCFNGSPTNVFFITDKPELRAFMDGKPRQSMPIHAATKLMKVGWAAACLTGTGGGGGGWEVFSANAPYRIAGVAV